jgi:hypothetical protein
VFDAAYLCTAINVYCSRDVSKVTHDLLETSLPLPPPPSLLPFHSFEEHPLLITVRKYAFQLLDQYLNKLCRDAGLRGQPINAFLRWGFGQRAMQDRLLPGDPLLPHQPSAEASLTLICELARSKIPMETAKLITHKLEHLCAAVARQVIELKRSLQAEEEKFQDEFRKQWAGNYELLNTYDQQGTVSQLSVVYQPPPHSWTHIETKKAIQAMHHLKQLADDNQIEALSQVLDDETIDKVVLPPQLVFAIVCTAYPIPLNFDRYEKLSIDYSRATEKVQADSFQLFLKRLWAMMARYDTISKKDTEEREL